MNLLPCPRSLKLLGGSFTLPKCVTLRLDASLKPDEICVITKRLHNRSAGLRPGVIKVQTEKRRIGDRRSISICIVRGESAPNHPEGYVLTVDHRGIRIEFRETPGLRAATATLRQIIRECARGTHLLSVDSQARTTVPLRLPCLKIRDWPDFPRRGVMLDVSRGRVPKLETLLELVEHLADFKINELQLYTEHTFAYRKYKSVWQSWGALTGAEIRRLDARCRELGIDLVPNQNSFGHLRYFLEDAAPQKARRSFRTLRRRQR